MTALEWPKAKKSFKKSSTGRFKKFLKATNATSMVAQVNRAAMTAERRWWLRMERKQREAGEKFNESS